MAGLNYGSSFRMKKQNQEGVIFMPKIGKWIVRARKKTPPTGTLTTIGSFFSKAEAEKFYELNK